MLLKLCRRLRLARFNRPDLRSFTKAISGSHWVGYHKIATFRIAPIAAIASATQPPMSAIGQSQLS
jgi:hypothetical protein